MVPIGFVSDHMEVVYDLDTEALATAEKLGLPARRAATAGHRPAVRRDGPRPAARAGRRRARRGGRPRQPSARWPACWDRCPVGCCPNPRGERPALCGRRLRDRVADRRRAARPRRSTSPAQAAELVRERRARRRRRSPPPSPAPSTSSPRPTARSEELIRERLAGGPPDDASSARRATTSPARSGVRWIVDPIDGTVNFLYGIPQYAVSIAAERRRRGRSPAWCSTSRPAPSTSAPPTTRRRRAPATACRSRSARPAPLAERLVAHRLHLRRPRSGSSRPRALARLLPRVRDIRRLGLVRPRPVPRRRGRGSTATSRRASTSGTTPPAGWSPQARRGPASRPAAGVGRPDLLVVRPGSTASTSSLRGRAGTAGFSRRVRGNSGRSPDVHAPRRRRRCAVSRVRWCTISPPTARPSGLDDARDVRRLEGSGDDDGD